MKFVCQTCGRTFYSRRALTENTEYIECRECKDEDTDLLEVDWLPDGDYRLSVPSGLRLSGVKLG